MSKTAIIGLIAVLIILAAGWYYWQQDGGTAFDPNRPYAISEEVGSGAATTGTTESPAQAGTLKGLLALGGAQECDITTSVGGVSTAGKVYVMGGKMRGNFTGSASGLTVRAHVLVDGVNVYTWMDGLDTGVKMPLTAASASGQANLDLNQQVNYTCRTWQGDAATFALPAGITFNTPGAVMPVAPPPRY